VRPHLLDRLRRSHGRRGPSRDLAHVTAPVARGDSGADARVEPAIVALAFATPHAAREALDTAHALAAGGELAVHDAVLFSRATDAPADVYETRDPTPAETAVPTGMLGAVVGTLVAGPLGLFIGAALGAGGGALAAKLIDTGIPDEVVIQVREMTAPGEYVLAVLVDHIHGAAVIDALRRFRGARVVFSTLPTAAVDLVRRTLTPTRSHARA
jgi:uncharacterized membrane protein